MKTSLQIVASAAIVMFAAYGVSGATYTFNVDRFNFNSTLSPWDNYSTFPYKPFAKDKQETTWYGDWSATQKQQIRDLLATPLRPGQYWEVSFRTATTNFIPHGGINFTPHIAVFFAAQDWDAATACYYEAARSYVYSVPWKHDQTGLDVEHFWQLRDITNSTPVVGAWQTPSALGNVQWNSAVLDAAVLDPLLNNPLARGLRAWDEEYWNDYTYTRYQWGGTAWPHLLVELIPEPATLALLGLGGLPLAARPRQ